MRNLYARCAEVDFPKGRGPMVNSLVAKTIRQQDASTLGKYELINETV